MANELCKDCSVTVHSDELVGGRCRVCEELSLEIDDELFEDDGNDEPWDGFQTDYEADADALASAGCGTDEDYGYYGENDYDCYDEY